MDVTLARHAKLCQVGDAADSVGGSLDSQTHDRESRSHRLQGPGRPTILTAGLELGSASESKRRLDGVCAVDYGLRCVLAQA